VNLRGDRDAVVVPTKIDSTSDAGWVEAAVARMRAEGFAVIAGMLAPELAGTYSDAIFRVREKTIAAVGLERFEQAIAVGYNELRLPFLFEPIFFDVLADPKVLALVDAVLGPASIVRFFNVMITPPETGEATARLTDQFHQNFKVPVNAGKGRRYSWKSRFPSPSRRKGSSLCQPATVSRRRRTKPIWRGTRLTSNGMSATPW